MEHVEKGVGRRLDFGESRSAETKRRAELAIGTRTRGEKRFWYSARSKYIHIMSGRWEYSRRMAATVHLHEACVIA
jgi:hypothetical protein